MYQFCECCDNIVVNYGSEKNVLASLNKLTLVIFSWFTLYCPHPQLRTVQIDLLSLKLRGGTVSKCSLCFISGNNTCVLSKLIYKAEHRELTLTSSISVYYPHCQVIRILSLGGIFCRMNCGIIILWKNEAESSTYMNKGDPGNSGQFSVRRFSTDISKNLPTLYVKYYLLSL